MTGYCCITLQASMNQTCTVLEIESISGALCELSRRRIFSGRCILCLEAHRSTRIGLDHREASMYVANVTPELLWHAPCELSSKFSVHGFFDGSPVNSELPAGRPITSRL